jgi:alpha-glucosidase (family GH31 glycosyl hydrolase)
MLKYFLILLFIQPFAAGQQWFGNYTSHSIDGAEVTVAAGFSFYKMKFISDKIVKFEVYQAAGVLFEESFAVITDSIASLLITEVISNEAIEFRTASLRLRFQKNPLRISFIDSEGNSLIKENPTGGIGAEGVNRYVNLEYSNDTYFYGTGARGHSLALNGSSFNSYNTQVYGYSTPEKTMNINIPFVTSSKGFALLYDNTYRSFFDFGTTQSNLLRYVALGGEVRFYFIAGNFEEQLEGYIQLTGRQEMPPKWALGYIQSKYGYRNEAEARGMVSTMRNKQIPSDAIVLDLYWFNNMGDLSWNLQRFPNPDAMVNDFLNLGIKTVLITEPYVIEYSNNYFEGAANGYFAKNNSGSTFLLNNWWSCNCNAALVDITNPNGANWWWSKHLNFWGNIGGIWTDLGEPERHPDNMLHFLGSAGKIHNIYNLLWAKKIYEGFSLLKPNERLFNLTRSGFAGMQRYGAVTWSGDVATTWGGLAGQVPMMLNMGLSGFGYHHSDIGGFTGVTSPELYIRWLQYGAFSPVMRAHGVDNQPQEPWGYGAAAEQIAKKFIQLRYKMLPYNYTLAYENYLKGTPIARPVFWKDAPFQQHRNNYDSYMWGDDIIVSPIYNTGQYIKQVVLPEGEWVNYWTNTIYNGGSGVITMAPLDQIPLYVRRGTIIPMQPVMNYVNEFPVDTILLAIYPGEANNFTMYEDDGRSLGYKTGEYSVTALAQYMNQGNLIVDLGASVGNFTGRVEERTYISEINLIASEPVNVNLNLIPMARYLSINEFSMATSGYFYSSGERKLYVKVRTSTSISNQLQIIEPVFTDVKQGDEVIAGFELMQNYPNPFNGETKIEYRIGEAGKVSLKVYDVLGEEVQTVLDEYQGAGIYSVKFNGGNLSSGVYFYKLSAGSFSVIRKMILLK